MKVLYITAECKPFSKAGGVGDVASELPVALQKAQIDIEIVTPWYGSTMVEDYTVEFHGKKEVVGIVPTHLKGVPVHFIKNPTYFEGRYGQPYINSDYTPYYDDTLRFSFFSEACLPIIEAKNPDIVHVNDWVLGYLFGRMAMKQMPHKRVMTVHNMAYQGNIWKGTIRGWHLEQLVRNPYIGPLFDDPRPGWDSVNPLRLGLELAHCANTVSPHYQHEITQPEDPERFFEGGKGLHEVTGRLAQAGRLLGILNGFEYHNEPTELQFAEVLHRKAGMKAALAQHFQQPDGILFGFVGRAVEQKFKLLTEYLEGKSVLEHILDIPGVNVAVLATGLPEYEAFLRRLQGRPNFAATIAFDRERAAQISLGSDVFLMPSLFEPCGITQMESLSCATPPLVRWTGGLVDTVVPHTQPHGTGFGFGGGSRREILENLLAAVRSAVNLYHSNPEAFRGLQHRGFQTRFLWSTAAQHYIQDVYEPVMRARH